jgi:acyl dehydratase
MTDSQPPRATELLYLDDLQIGQRFTSEAYSLDDDMIKSFAGEFDPQPFHLDGQAAQETLFGGLAASGWHTAAITMRLLVHSLPLAGGVIGAGAKVTWPRPARPGFELHVESAVTEIRPSRSNPRRGIVTVRTETRNQHGDVVQILISKLVVPRRG